MGRGSDWSKCLQAAYTLCRVTTTPQELPRAVIQAERLTLYLSSHWDAQTPWSDPSKLINSWIQTWMPSFLWSVISALSWTSRFVCVFPRKVTKSCATPPQLVAFKVVKWWTVMVTNVLKESVFLWIIVPCATNTQAFLLVKVEDLFCLFPCFHSR